MKDEFIKYLESIEMTEQAYIKRIENIIDIFTEIIKEDIEEIFVSDYIKEDGSRIYENIDLFTKRYNLGAEQFLDPHKDHFTISERKEIFTILTIKKTDYDLKTAQSKSRLSIEVRYNDKTMSVFKASKENCDFLKNIILKYFIHNM